MWGAYRVSLLMGDVGPEHGFCHFETSALGELRGHSIFYPQPPKETSSNSIPIFSFFKVFPLGSVNPS